MPEVVREHFEAGSEEGTVLRLDRPPVNALWVDLLDELRHALQEEIEAGAAAIVLTGSGSCFSAGIDIKASAGATRAQPVPVVAAVNGHALGGGLVLPLACDLVMATRAPCKLGLNEVAAGVPFPAAALAAPRARLSPPVFNNLCLTGRTFDPEEALALGVVDELCDGDPAARAKEVASALAGFPAYARVKEQVRAPQLAEMRELVANDPMLTSWLA
jgi:enoyl-CoA hydratase